MYRHWVTVQNRSNYFVKNIMGSWSHREDEAFKPPATWSGNHPKFFVFLPNTWLSQLLTNCMKKEWICHLKSTSMKRWHENIISSPSVAGSTYTLSSHFLSSPSDLSVQCSSGSLLYSRPLKPQGGSPSQAAGLNGKLKECINSSI